MDARENTPEGNLLDILVAQVEAYEDKHYPIDLPDNISAIKFTCSTIEFIFRKSFTYTYIISLQKNQIESKN